MKHKLKLHSFREEEKYRRKLSGCHRDKCCIKSAETDAGMTEAEPRRAAITVFKLSLSIMHILDGNSLYGVPSGSAAQFESMLSHDTDLGASACQVDESSEAIYLRCLRL